MSTTTDSYIQIEQLLIDSSASSQVWDDVARMVERVVPCDRMVIASVDVPRGLFSPFHISGVSVPVWDSTPIHTMGESLIGAAVLSDRPVMSDRIPSSYEEQEGPLNGCTPTAYWESAMGMRIVSSGETVGAVVFLSHQPGIYGPAELRAAERISRVFAPYLAQQVIQKEVQRVTEHNTNLEYLIRHLNDSLDPSTFFNMFYSAFASRASLIYAVLFSIDRYSDKYIKIAHVDGVRGGDDSTLDEITQLVNDQRLSGLSVHLACEHKSVPNSNIGLKLTEMVIRSPNYRELGLVPLTADMKRVGAIFFATADCNPSMLDRVREIEAAGPIASAYLRHHQTSRVSDRQQHIATMLQHAVDGMCRASGARQKVEVFEVFLLQSLGAAEYVVEIKHRVTGAIYFKQEHPTVPLDERASHSGSGAETVRVISQLRDTHVIEVSATFDPDTNRMPPHHELRAAIRVCAAILGAAVLADQGNASAPQYSSRALLDGREEVGARSRGLSDREMQILKLLSHGATNDEIAAYCGLASGTVKNKLVSIYKKLGVRNRSQASRAALLIDEAKP